MITEDYVSFEIAKLLEEKGFDETCYACYEYFSSSITMYSGWPFEYKGKPVHNTDNMIKCPTHQMAMKWLREKQRTSIIIEFDLTKRGYCPYVHQLDYDMDWVVKWRINTPMKYEQAIEAALKYSLENLI